VAPSVIFSPKATADLTNLYDYIAEQSGPVRAMGYIGRIDERALRGGRQKRRQRRPK
jgi:plasmid stabilization system protein ParE